MTFVGARVYGYKPNFSKLVILLISDSIARRRQRFVGGHFAKSDDQKIELDFIAYSVVIKFIPT